MAEPFSKWEYRGAILTTALFPFWFLHLPGINIGPADIIAIVVALTYAIRTARWTFTPSPLTGIGIGLFLFIGGLSVFWSPVTIEALRQFLQYGLIFLVVIPVIVIGFSDYQRRWHLYVVVMTTLSGIIITGAIYALLTEPKMRYYSFIYGNQNTFYWAVAAGTTLALGLAAHDSHRFSVRFLAASIAALGVVLISSGNAMTAMLAVGVGIWVIVFWLLRNQEGHADEVAFVGLSAVFSIAIVLLITANWEFFYREAVLHQRIPMYQQAWDSGVEFFPWGIGLGGSPAVLSDLPDSTPSITHNFLLHYWLTIGVVGVLGFLMILLAWARNVPLQMVLRPQKFRAFEVALIAVFLGYVVIALFQPPPVRRFWWLFFAVGWASVIDPN